MIRPSALNFAEKCGLAAKLAIDYPESSTAAQSGHRQHSEIAALINGIKLPSPSPEATWAVEWLRAAGTNAKAEVPVELHDPESGTLLTKGTLDAVVAVGDGELLVVDWKGGDPDNVPDVEDSLQLAAYAIGHGLTTDAPAVSWQYVFLRERRASLACRVEQAAWWGWLDRIRKASSREPQATPGPHCGRCYQRQVCGSYRERAALAMTVLPDAGVTLSDDTAAQLVQRIGAVRDAIALAEDLAKAYVNAGGRIEVDGRVWRPSTVIGRKSADVASLEAAGLTEYIRAGAPYERWSWSKVRR